MINGVDRFGFVLLHEVNLRPIVSSLGILAWFILLDSLLAFFLSMSLDLAEVALFAASVAVASSAGISSSSWVDPWSCRMTGLSVASYTTLENLMASPLTAFFLRFLAKCQLDLEVSDGTYPLIDF